MDYNKKINELIKQENTIQIPNQFEEHTIFVLKEIQDKLERLDFMVRALRKQINNLLLDK